MSGTRRVAWITGLVVGFAGVTAFLVAPPGTAAAVAAYHVTAILALAAVLLGVLALPPSTRAPWLGVVGYMAFAEAGDLVYHVQSNSAEGLQYPGLADALYFAAYACMIGTLVVLIRRMSLRSSLEAWIDTAILAVAATALVGVFVLARLVRAGDLDGFELAVTLAYPLVDLVLLAALVRLLVGAHVITPAIALLAAAFAITFVADLVYAYVAIMSPDGGLPDWTDALYLVVLVLLACAIWTDSAATDLQTREPDVREPAVGRTVALALGALTVPAILAVLAWGDSAPGAVALALACMAVIALVLWRFQMLLDVVAEQAVTLSSLARTDSLTGLPNRRTLGFELERMEAATALAGEPITVAMIDLDHFKAFNDEHGHAAGDDALIAGARAWAQALGDDGLLARYGGEEFAVLLPGHGLRSAEAVLQRIRRATPAPHTISVGFAERRPGESAFDTMGRADRALYSAKEAGRDRVMSDVLA